MKYFSTICNGLLSLSFMEEQPKRPQNPGNKTTIISVKKMKGKNLFYCDNHHIFLFGILLQLYTEYMLNCLYNAVNSKNINEYKELLNIF